MTILYLQCTAGCVDLAKIKLKSGKEETLNTTPQSHATVLHEEKNA